MITAISRSVFDTVSNGVAVAEPPRGAAEQSQPRVLPTNSAGLGRDQFLKILVSQLKNQDPLNPMDGKDMAAQLAQFSAVEQLIDINKSVTAAQEAQEATAAAIGALEKTQNERANELASLIEGQDWEFRPRFAPRDWKARDWKNAASDVFEALVRYRVGERKQYVLLGS